MDTAEYSPTRRGAFTRALIAALIAVMTFLIAVDLYSMFTQSNPHYTGIATVSSKEHIEGARNLAPGGEQRPDRWILTLCPESDEKCFRQHVSEDAYQDIARGQTVTLNDGNIAR